MIEPWTTGLGDPEGLCKQLKVATQVEIASQKPQKARGIRDRGTSRTTILPRRLSTPPNAHRRVKVRVGGSLVIHRARQLCRRLAAVWCSIAPRACCCADDRQPTGSSQPASTKARGNTPRRLVAVSRGSPNKRHRIRSRKNDHGPEEGPQPQPVARARTGGRVPHGPRGALSWRRFAAGHGVERRFRRRLARW